ncbi:hypothetical protein ACVR1I_00150 [Streptococcus cameli]
MSGRQDRQANSAILGYSYQFLHTIKDMLSGGEEEKFLLEGIEDLDVIKSDEIDLIQYKYHEEKNLSNSLVAKPITLMYNHFLQHENSSYKYRLFIKGKNNNFEINVSNFQKMFKIKASKEHQITTKNDEGKIVPDEDYQDSCKINSFISKFELQEVPDFEALEKEVIALIRDTLNISDKESECQVYPFAYKWVNEKSRQKEKSNRWTTKVEFINELCSTKKQNDFSLMKRLYGEKIVVKKIKEELKNKNVKKNSVDHVFVINNHDSHDTAQLITNLVKKFTYRENKNDIRVPLFIVENMSNLKKEIVTISRTENLALVFNDGFEDYGFDQSVFNREYIVTGNPKILKTNYNFKIISKQTYLEKKIELKNPAYFFIRETIEVENSSKVFLLNGLENNSILSIFNN